MAQFCIIYSYKWELVIWSQDYNILLAGQKAGLIDQGRGSLQLRFAQWKYEEITE